MSGPTYHVVAGPNGAGKSTLTNTGRFPNVATIDPDDIARRLDPDAPQEAGPAADREAARQIRRNLDDGRDFAQETTLSSATPLANAHEARKEGFRVELHYVGVDNVHQSRQRVDDRVRDGGHDISTADIERRFPKSIRNAERLSEIADKSTFYDNSSPDRAHRVVLEREGRRMSIADNAPAWAKEIHDNLRQKDRESMSRDVSKSEPEKHVLSIEQERQARGLAVRIETERTDDPDQYRRTLHQAVRGDKDVANAAYKMLGEDSRKDLARHAQDMQREKAAGMARGMADKLPEGAERDTALRAAYNIENGRLGPSRATPEQQATPLERKEADVRVRPDPERPVVKNLVEKMREQEAARRQDRERDR